MFGLACIHYLYLNIIQYYAKLKLCNAVLINLRASGDYVLCDFYTTHIVYTLKCTYVLLLL